MEENASSLSGDKSSQSEALSKEKKHLSFFNIAVYLLALLYFFTVIISLKIISAKSKISGDSPIRTNKIAKIIKNNKIVVVPVYGAIYKRESSFSKKGSDFIIGLMKKYAEDNDVKAFVLDINSPGGSIGAVEEIYSMIMKIRNNYKKPVVAHFGDVAASGGYYIASACDKIVSNSGTLTGSIGVIFTTAEGENLLKKIGINFNTVKSGKFKDIGSFSRQMTKEERKILEDMINDAYSLFVSVVAKGRKMSEEKVKELADGRIFTGKQALSVGLVDMIGDLDDSINEAAKISGIGKDYEVVKARGDLIDEIFIGLDSSFGFFNVFSFKNITPVIEYRLIM